MTTISMPSSLALVPSLEMAWQDVDSSFERFCLTAGIGAIEQMLCEDAQRLAGAPHSRGGGRVGHRWGRTKGKIGFHGGNVAVHRPRVRGFDGHEIPLPTWTAAPAENWLGRWAMNLMLINVSTQRVDAQAQACGAAARGRSAGDCRGRHLEVGGLAPVRGAVGRTAG